MRAARAGSRAIRGRPISTPRRSRRLPPVLEVAEVEALLDAVGPVADAASAHGIRRIADALELRDRALVETAYAGGLRISELAGRVARRRSTWPHAEMRVMGKGRKERVGLLGAPARGALSTAYLARRSAPSARPRRSASAGTGARATTTVRSS